MTETEDGIRKLAAIMFTDMVGFSALTQSDEALALKLLAEHNEIFRAVLAKYEGREVKSTGDGFLLEFPSALVAVKCAIDVQQTIHDRNLVESDKIGVRIGIHVGDIVTKDGDILGDGVNIAARIEPLADTGGICVSGSVAEQVGNKISNALAAIGKADLKNIKTSIEVHKVYMPWEDGAPKKKPLKKQRLVALLVSIVAVFAVVLGAWTMFGSKSNPPLTESQQLVSRAADMVDDPMANRDSWLTAFDLCQEAIELDSQNGDAYATAAQISYWSMLYYGDVTPENLENAKGLVSRAKQFAPDSIETLLAAQAQMIFEKDPENQQYLLKLHDQFPDEPRIVEGLARNAIMRVDKRNPDFSEFDQWRAKVRELGGDEYKVLNVKAGRMFQDSNFLLALDAIDDSLAIQENAMAHQWKFSVLVTGLGDFKRAEEHLPELPKSIRREDRIVFMRNRMYYWSGQYQKVIEDLNSWSRLFLVQGGFFKSVDYLRGIAYEKQGLDSMAKLSFEAGLKAVNERLDTEPNTLDMLTEKTIILFKLERNEEAMAFGKAAKEAWGRTYTELDVLMGNYDEVIDALHDRIAERGDFGLLQYTEAKYDPHFDPLRDDPRFIEIMKAGKEWMDEVTLD